MRRASSIFATAGFCTEAWDISLISSLLIPTYTRKIRPYTRCNLHLTLLHTCRHCHSNLWQTESQMNLFRFCICNVFVLEKCISPWDIELPAGLPEFLGAKVFTNITRQWLSTVPWSSIHTVRLETFHWARVLVSLGMLNWMQWDECSHASYPPGKPTQEPERGKWDNSWSMASLGWNKSKSSRDVQVQLILGFPLEKRHLSCLEGLSKGW